MEEIVRLELEKLEESYQELSEKLKERITSPGSYYEKMGTLPAHSIASTAQQLKMVQIQITTLKQVLALVPKDYIKIDVQDNTSDEFRDVVKHNGRMILNLAIDEIIEMQNHLGRFLDGEHTIQIITNVFSRHFDDLY